MHFLNYYASFTAAEGVKLFASVKTVGRVVGVAVDGVGERVDVDARGQPFGIVEHVVYSTAAVGDDSSAGVVTHAEGRHVVNHIGRNRQLRHSVGIVVECGQALNLVNPVAVVVHPHVFIRGGGCAAADFGDVAVEVVSFCRFHNYWTINYPYKVRHIIDQLHNLSPPKHRS